MGSHHVLRGSGFLFITRDGKTRGELVSYDHLNQLYLLNNEEDDSAPVSEFDKYFCPAEYLWFDGHEWG